MLRKQLAVAKEYANEVDQDKHKFKLEVTRKYNNAIKM